jgi:uncharacterized membrane protein
MTTLRRPLRCLLAVAVGSALALGAPLAAAAGAAELKLHCAGKGARNKDSAGTVLCAADPGRSRSVAGTVRNDAGQPVAGKLTVTYSSWTPATSGSGYTVKPYATRELTADADGSFSVPSNTKTRESIRIDLAADPTLGIVAGVRAEAQVSRRLVTKIKKLGGGRVKLTIKGTKVRPLKLYVLDPSGYPLPGVKAKQANRAGSATFNLGSRRGKFTTYVDAGVYGDLFWYQSRPGFRL